MAIFTLIDYITIDPGDERHRHKPTEVAIRLGITDDDVLIGWQTVGANPDSFRAVAHSTQAWTKAPFRSVRRKAACQGLGLPAELPHFVSNRVVAILADLHWSQGMLGTIRGLKTLANERGPHVYIDDNHEDD